MPGLLILQNVQRKRGIDNFEEGARYDDVPKRNEGNK